MFKCPDGIIRQTSVCLDKCPRPEGRCLSLPYLTEVAYNRPFTKPSVTQCLNPTRMEYLKLKYDYAVNPTDRAFALLGTRVHRRLEIVADKIEQVIAEHKVQDADTIGTLDLLEPDELNDGYWKLIDSKTWGSYAVAKQLGMKKNGEHDIYKNTLQLNGYRIKVEPLEFKVSRMFIQAIIRDGGTYTSKGNGINDKVLMIPIKHLPDDEVQSYFYDKSQALINAIETNIIPPMCNYEDNWGNRRCKDFCEVNAYCREGAMVSKIEYKGDW